MNKIQKEYHLLREEIAFMYDDTHGKNLNHIDINLIHDVDIFTILNNKPNSITLTLGKRTKRNLS